MLDDMGRACMNLLIEKFERIKEIDHDWAQTVYEERKQNTTPENKELVNAFNELFSTAREAYKKDAKKTESIFKTYMTDDGAWLLEDVISSLEIFFTLSELREMQASDEEKAKKVIEYFFDNAIVYFDRQFANVYDEFGFQTLDSFYNTARVLDGLTEYYVMQHLSSEAIKRDLKSETEFGENTCGYLAHKISENYHTLQMNILMDMIRADKEK